MNDINPDLQHIVEQLEALGNGEGLEAQDAAGGWHFLHCNPGDDGLIFILDSDLFKRTETSRVAVLMHEISADWSFVNADAPDDDDEITGAVGLFDDPDDEWEDGPDLYLD